MSYAGAVIDVSTQLDSNVVQAAETPTNHQQPEDVEATVVTLLNSTFPGLNMQTSDIDRAHRSRDKIWCRFVKSESAQPWKTKRAVLQSQIRRAIKLSSDDNARHRSINKTRELFANNGYNVKTINKAVDQCMNTTRARTRRPNASAVRMVLPFVDDELANAVHGIVPYIKQCALLRIVGHIKFSYVTLEVLQSATHAEDDTVRIRWRIRGVSALKSMLMFWKFNVFKLEKAIDEYGVDWYDGYSIFQVGGDGKVHTHIADKVMPDWSRDLAVKPALGGLAALVLGLLPGTAGASDQLGHLLTSAGGDQEQVARLRSLASRLEQLERQMETLLPLPPGGAHWETAGDT
ncbi:uncharacterized protein FJT64_022014 [Amphibalanus amphitrite]|uniref:Helix-turn-helix domain-containing protein n=1 Tax=Amphibalanus amphitrite TaxID=1232801 RepID=A0A6A4WIA6_AMPAM|nr:uncharacterized protein FJT64_022014 [Amphibalanus amphitrite]